MIGATEYFQILVSTIPDQNCLAKIKSWGEKASYYWSKEIGFSADRADSNQNKKDKPSNHKCVTISFAFIIKVVEKLIGTIA